MSELNDNRPPDEEENNISDDMSDGMPDFIEDAINDLNEKIGVPTSPVVLPIGLIPKSIRDKICQLCQKQESEDVADLDINEMEEWHSINAEIERVRKIMIEADKDMDRAQARKNILCCSLELKHNVAGERLRIENGKLIRRFCAKEADDHCSIN